MDIESKKWRVRSCAAVVGHVEITNKPGGGARYIPARDVPLADRLAMMKEADFDRAIANAYLDNG